MEKMVTSSAIGSIVCFTQIQIMNKLHPDIGLILGVNKMEESNVDHRELISNIVKKNTVKHS